MVMINKPPGPERAAELEDLRARLAEAEEALRTIRNGEVDAVVVKGGRGKQVYTLRGADRVYRQLIETMSEGAATLSADGVILYGNVRLAEMLGRPLDQVLGTALRKYLPPADRQALDAIFAQARTAVARQEINLKNSEGRLVPVYLSASRLQNERTEMVFCFVLTDLTEQKRQEQIVAAERLARLILEQVAEAIVVCDERGRVIRASQAARQFCDGNPLYRPFAEVFPLRTDASDPFHLAPVLQGETLRNMDVTLDWQGQKFDLILSAGPLVSDRQILGCVVTLTDITERKRAEEALRAERGLMATLIDNLPDNVFIKDIRGGIILDNLAHRRILGRQKMDEVAGKSDRDFFASALADQYMDDERRIVESGRPLINYEEPVVDSEGRSHWYLTTKVPVRDSHGSVTALVGINRDITERKRAEEEIRVALREKEVLLREIHHRVKNNMQVISSLFNLQAGHTLNEEGRAILKEAQARIHAMSLVHEKLYQSGNLSRIDLGGYINNLAFHLVHFYRSQPGLVRLETDFEDATLDIASAIPCGLLLNELISNALKHAFPENRAGVVRIGLKHETGGLIELRVADDGVGFPENLNFRKAESLGLQIVNLLVGQLGGTIELDRTNGTAFTVAFREFEYPSRA